MMKRPLILFLFFIVSCSAFAQHERANWIMGNKVGLKFGNSSINVFPENTSQMYASSGSAVYSNPVTGELLLYTNGSTVYTRSHTPMVNGNKINNDTASIHSLILPHPSRSNIFYIISSGKKEKIVYYTLVDLTKQSGQGEVVSKGNVLVNNADFAFCAVKQLYSEGYWLITHQNNANEFRSFRIGQIGVDTNYVASKAGTVTDGNTLGADKITSNSSGTEFVLTFGRSKGNGAIVERFTFNKRCGLVSFKEKPVFDSGCNECEQIAHAAYSPDGNKLYVYWYYGGGVTFIQYNLNDPSSLTNAKVLMWGYGIKEAGDMQLAEDGKIYQILSLNSKISSRLNVIENPNFLGDLCNYKLGMFDISIPSETYLANRLPEFMLDVSNMPEGYERATVLLENYCEGDSFSFAIQNKMLYADSVKWVLGDGEIIKKGKGKHVYKEAGVYNLVFSWFVCGYQYSVSDTVRITKKPSFSLGNDTTVCFGELLSLNGPPSLDGYLWNTGDTTRSIIAKNEGKYLLAVKNGLCWAKSEMKVDYYSQIYTALGDEYFICDDDKELVKLDAGGDFIQYKWTPTGDTTQWIIVGDLGQYFVIVKDFRGCDGSDGTKVERRCPVSVFYPNAFTPNADGKNDLYLPVGSDVVAYTITIYNAWGQKIFKTQNISEGWDGTFNGKPAPNGTYIYQSTYSGYRNKQLVSFDEKGNITLIR